MIIIKILTVEFCRAQNQSCCLKSLKQFGHRSHFCKVRVNWLSLTFLDGRVEGKVVCYGLFCSCSLPFAIFHFGQHKLQRVKANINRRKRTIIETLTGFYQVASYNCKGLKQICEVNTRAQAIFNTYYFAYVFDHIAQVVKRN